MWFEMFAVGGLFHCLTISGSMQPIEELNEAACIETEILLKQCKAYFQSKQIKTIRPNKTIKKFLASTQAMSGYQPFRRSSYRARMNRKRDRSTYRGQMWEQWQEDLPEVEGSAANDETTKKEATKAADAGAANDEAVTADGTDGSAKKKQKARVWVRGIDCFLTYRWYCVILYVFFAFT